MSEQTKVFFRPAPRSAVRFVAVAAAVALLWAGRPAPAGATDTPLFTAADASLPAGVSPQTGYRMGRYRGPTPAHIPGGYLVSDRWMLDAVDSGRVANGAVVLIDVYPPKGLGPDPLDGSWRNSEQRSSIAGAVWLPETGRGHLEPDAIDYLTRNLKRLSGGDFHQPMVFFCTADCWQGWNAARRAIRMGYDAVYWYPNGTDGWRDHGRSVESVQPQNFLD